MNIEDCIDPAFDTLGDVIDFALLFCVIIWRDVKAAFRAVTGR